MSTHSHRKNDIPFIRRLIATPIAGLIAGIIAVSNAITYGVLIFSGSLSLNLSTGIGMALFSGMVLATVIALLSSAPGMIASPQTVTASISALLAAQIVGGMPRASTPEETFITVVAAITFSAFSTGIIFITLGRLKLNNFCLIFAHLSPKIEQQLISEGIFIENDKTVQSFPDIDHAVEWCENRFY